MGTQGGRREAGGDSRREVGGRRQVYLRTELQYEWDKVRELELSLALKDPNYRYDT